MNTVYAGCGNSIVRSIRTSNLHGIIIAMESVDLFLLTLKTFSIKLQIKLLPYGIISFQERIGGRKPTAKVVAKIHPASLTSLYRYNTVQWKQEALNLFYKQCLFRLVDALSSTAKNSTLVQSPFVTWLCLVAVMC